MISGYPGYKPEHPSTIYVSRHKEPIVFKKAEAHFPLSTKKTVIKCQTPVSLYLEEKLEKHTNDKKKMTIQEGTKSSKTK